MNTLSSITKIFITIDCLPKLVVLYYWLCVQPCTDGNSHLLWWEICLG